MLTFQSFYITILLHYCNITEVFALWFPIDYNSHVPIYKQIEGKIKELIVKGQLREGQFVPSIRVLARDIGVNVNTVARPKDKGLHFGIPPPGLVPEVYSRFKKFFHGYQCHTVLPPPLVIPPPPLHH